MTLQEKLQKKAEGFGKLAPVFLEGTKFALSNQWISAEDSLPYNYEELLKTKEETVIVITINKYEIIVPMIGIFFTFSINTSYINFIITYKKEDYIFFLLFSS